VVQQRVATSTIAVLALVLSVGTVPAEMGPFLLDGHQSLYCGEGNGAARIIRDTSSPSHQFALAWRLTSKPPISPPSDSDPDLENLIIRISDGAILAKSHGFYWDLGDRYAPRQYLRAAWSPNSRLLIRTAGRIGVPDTAELFTFTDDNSVMGPFDLVSVFDPVVRAQMKGAKDADQHLFRLSYSPRIAIDDQGLIHASVYLQPRDSGDGPVYELTARVERTANSLDAKVLSISEYLGPSISVIVHQP
jgi:hypothetical protein